MRIYVQVIVIEVRFAMDWKEQVGADQDDQGFDLYRPYTHI